MFKIALIFILMAYMCKVNFIFADSLTDSICTAYENKIVKSNIDTKSHSSDGEKEFAPMTNLTSMLGGKVNEFY